MTPGGEAPESERLWRAMDLPMERMDELPFGAIVVDETGRILAYNEYETRLSRMDRERVIGKNFFRDVAPCTAVQAFEGRMREFRKGKARVSETFDYFFPFAHGAADVSITFLRLHEKGQFLIAVEQVRSAPT